MTIATTPVRLHWNYFLALERDLDTLSRYIEFAEPNFGTFSVELARLLFAASSEVDVVAKLLCEQLSPDQPRSNINEYKAVLKGSLPDLPDTEVFLNRHGLSFRPFANWRGENNPDWWRSYNNVKHERASRFHEATLKNALNALGALLIVTFHYYSRKLGTVGQVLEPREATKLLEPKSSLLLLRPDFYYYHLLI